MGDFDATVIVGNLDGKELLSSIDKLVQDVSVKTNKMAEGFTQGIDRMKLAMKDFAITQKVSVDLMQEAWRKMSSSFDAMVAAQSNATGSGRKTTNNGGGASFPDNTVGNLKEVIALEEKRRLDMERGTQELRDQNKLIADQKQQLKEELMTEEEKKKAIEKQNEALERQKAKQLKKSQAPYLENWNTARKMSDVQLDDAEKKLQALRREQEKMQKSGLFNQAKLNEAQQAIDRLREKIERLRSKKPKTLKEVLGMDENGVDAIAAKLKALRSVQVAPDSSQATLLANEYQRLKKVQGDLLGQNAKLIGSNNYLAQSFGYIRNRIVSALTLGAITNFTKQIYEIRGQYELLERSLGVLTNSFQKGSQIFQELNDMAIKSPFTLMELATAAKQLTAYNFAADEVVDTTRRLADISAALGVPMERLTYNLGQIRAQTVLTARDARDFANAGLPMVKTLADYYTELEGRVVSTGDVYDRMSKKMVSYADVMAVLNKMTDEGGKFFDFQAKQAETLKVQMNNLTLAWNNMLNEIGKDNQSLLELPLKGLRTIFENWESVNRVLTNLVVILGTAKVAQLAFNMALGKGNIEQLRSIALMPKATMTNYKNALSKMEITKAQAKLMVATNRGNENLQKAIIKMKLLTKTEVEAAASTNALRNSWTIFSNTIAIGAAKIGKSLMALATNPATWIFAATYAVTDFISSIGEASEKAKEFNDTIGKNATENTNSIGKFLDDYAKSFDKLRDGKMEQTEQVKLWEAIREEIKKSSQNADDYIAKLERLNDFNERNTKGGEFLSTIKQIQEFANAAQEQGLIKANEDSWIKTGLDKDLEAWADEMSNALRKAEDDFDGFTDKYEKLFDIINNPSNYNNGAILQWENNLASATELAQSNLAVFTQSIAESMEKMWNPNVEKNATNIREYVNTIVKAYKDAHPTIKGQAERFLDINVDKFVAKQVRTFATVKDKNDEFLQETYSSWRIFYDKLRSEGGQEFDGLLQYVTKTGDYSNKEFEKIWKKAAETMKREAGDAYATIDEYIADLNTRKIVIPVLFQQKQIEGDNLQKDFTQHFIEDGLNLMKDEESYQQEMLRRTRLYKDLNQKDGEDTVKWNKRLNDLYNDDLAKIAKQDEIMSKITDKESVRYKEAKETKDFYEKQVGAIKEVVEYEGFSLEQKNKKGRKGSQKDLVLEALKNEIDLIKKAQSEYEKLTKDGASANDALVTLNGAFGKTVTLLNSRLASYGLPLLDLENVVKGNPKETLAFLEKISKALTDRGLSNLERMKVVEVAIEEFKFKVKKFDLEEITNRLKLELDKLKKEFEVALEIDANPELGTFFASIFDIDKDSLPHTITEYEKRVTDAINRTIKERGDKLKLDSLRLTPDDLQAFSKMAKNGELNPQSLSDIENAYKVMHDLRVKAAQDVAKIANDYIKQYGDLSAQLVEVEQEKNNSLQKLDEIYYTEDMRRSKEYLDAKNAILDGAKRKQAKIEFDFLKKSSDVERFLTAIETLTEGQALEIKKKIKQGIIKAFKDGGLTVSQFRKEIKALEDQFDKLSKISPNWMTYLNNGFDGLIQKAKTTGQEVETIGEKISVEGKIDDKDKNFLSSLGSIFSDGGGGKMDITQLMGKFGNNMQGLGKAVSGAGSGMQGAASKFSGAIAIVDTIIKNVHQTIQALGSVVDELDSVRNEENKISNAYWEGFKKFDNYAYSGWENFKSGNIAGAAADTVNSIVSVFNAFSNAKNDKINKQLKESERIVNRLANSYKELESAIGDALGTSEMAAQKTLIANKKLQLAELERQLQLEKERDSKRRDTDRIIELEGQIIDARNELKEMTDDITNSFMGISSVKDAVTSMVEGVVDALRSGEDAMQSFDDNIDDMIAHMIQQIALSQIVTPKLKAILDNFSTELQSRGEGEASKLEKAQREYENIAKENGEGYYFFKDRNGQTTYFNDIHKAIIAQKRLGLTNISYDEWKQNAQKEIKKLEKNLDSAMMPTTGDLRNLVTSLDEIRPELSSDWEAIRALLDEFGLIKGDSSKQLSNLQQGISSISESTANALEAYLNIISQRIFEHGTVFYEIRNIISSWNMDAHLGVQSQMLLQLQNSYQTQMAIQNLLEGTLTPNGRAFMVELNS